jgi:SNF2 family DNA or RNA helicase
METEEQVRQLQRRIAPHMLRRVKEDVASDIPPKEETVVDVELTLLQKQYYRAIFEKNHAILSKVRNCLYYMSVLSLVLLKYRIDSQVCAVT